MFGVSRQTGSTLVELAAELQHFSDLAHALTNLRFSHAPVTQGKSQVIGHGHGVVNDRELEHLRNIALLRRFLVDVFTIETHLALRGFDQARNDVEHGGFAAARRPEQGIRTACLKAHLHGQQGVVAVLLGVGAIGVGQVQIDTGHHLSVPPDANAQVRTTMHHPRQTHRHLADEDKPPGWSRCQTHAHRFFA